MSALEPERSTRRQSPREKQRSRLVRAALIVLLTVLAFLLGIAFSRTLDERPSRGNTVTTVGTLPPVQQESSPETVTVTATTP